MAAFLGVFILPGIAQSVLLTVVPLEALRLLGTARAVTLLYAVAGLAAVVGRFSIPVLVQLIQRRSVFSLERITVGNQRRLMGKRQSGGICLRTCIPRHALRHFELTRIFACAGPWTLGPWLGVYLQQSITFAAPFAVAALAATVLLLFFWWLRLTERAPSKRKPPNPMRYLPRFFSQPRLRLAWCLAGARSVSWSTFYIYTPIFAVTSGLSAETGGAIASIGTSWIFLVPLWGWVGRRHGLRRLLAVGYAMAGIMTMATATAFDLPWVGAVMLVLAGFGAEMIDGA